MRYALSDAWSRSGELLYTSQYGSPTLMANSTGLSLVVEVPLKFMFLAFYRNMPNP